MSTSTRWSSWKRQWRTAQLERRCCDHGQDALRRLRRHLHDGPGESRRRSSWTGCGTANSVLTKIDLSDVKVKLIGSIAIVTSLAEVEGTNEGAPMQGTYRYTRVYQRLPSGVWKITSFEATRVGSPTSTRSAASEPAAPSPGRGEPEVQLVMNVVATKRPCRLAGSSCSMQSRRSLRSRERDVNSRSFRVMIR